MRVEQLMCHAVATCQSGDSLAHAARLMWDHDIGFVPVLDAAGKLVGAVTDRDLAMAAFLEQRRLEEIPLSQVMSRSVVSCAPELELVAASNIMKRARVRRLPVVDAAGKLVGVLSVNDLVRVAETPKAITPRELAATLASICTPRIARAPH